MVYLICIRIAKRIQRFDCLDKNCCAHKRESYILHQSHDVRLNTHFLFVNCKITDDNRGVFFVSKTYICLRHDIFQSRKEIFIFVEISQVVIKFAIIIHTVSCRHAIIFASIIASPFGIISQNIMIRWRCDDIINHLDVIKYFQAISNNILAFIYVIIQTLMIQLFIFFV